MAQCCNHVIMPLASRRDKYTEALWGIRDFEMRFQQRPPEGMWLPETATMIETLEVLAELGIKFTILSPSRPAKSDRLGRVNGRMSTAAQLDPTMPYLVKLPNGKSITVFFYDALVSRAVAFEHLLRTMGRAFHQRLVGSIQRRAQSIISINAYRHGR